MKKSKIIGSVVFIAGLIVAGFWFYILRATDSYAASGAAGDHSSGCTWYCTTWGAGWHRQSLDSFLSWSWDSARTLGSGVNKAAIKSRCESIGASEIYRLSFERAATKGNGTSFTAGAFSGLVNVSTGQGIYQPDIAEDWGEVSDLFSIAEAHGGTDTSWNGTAWFCWDPSWACPTGDPDCTPPPPAPTPSATPYFYSRSKVVVDSGDVPTPDNSLETPNDGNASMEFSVDRANVTVTFSHTLYYDHGGFALDSSKGDKFTTSATAGDTEAGSGKDDVDDSTNMYTPYTVTTNGASVGSGNSDRYTTTDGNKTYYNENFTFNLTRGVPQTACSQINYSQKTATINSAEHITTHYQAADPGKAGYVGPDGSFSETYIPGYTYDSDYGKKDKVDKVSHTDYYLSGYTGNGSSEVCVTVIWPEDPGGDPENPNPNVSGNPAANVMFAGESTTLKWNINATGVPTRRLVERSVTGHLVPASNGQSYITGNSRSWSTSPQSYYNTGTTYEFNNATWSDESVTDSYNAEISVKVPNDVGAKYCNSAGYRFESYYIIDRGDGAGPQPYHDSRSNKNYWFIFNSSCRTIAKKPTAAIWNGGIFTSGGIKTSIAKRFNTINFGDTTSTAPTDQTTFGSWSEFLTAANGAVGDGESGFASGSVFYKGTGNSLRDSYPLTISNTDTDNPGRSGIGINSTLRTRLEAYLKNRASGIGNTISGLSNVTGTQIYSVSGDLKIDGNITTAAGPHTSIYDIPQVVIFVDGKVNISSDVTRIDAWIIATGEINTCTEFNNSGSGTTTSDSGSWSHQANGCANQLIFNGPVMANNLVLNRSYGSNPMTNQMTRMAAAPTQNMDQYIDNWGNLTNASAYNTSRQAPAEIFNLRADTYLWAYAQSTRYDSSFTETYSRELAPRY